MAEVIVPPHVIALIPKIGADAFTIWTYLNALADDNGDVDASYQAIADGTGVKARATISACVKVLVAVGLLTKKRNYSAAVTYTVIRSLDDSSSNVKRMNANSYTPPPLPESNLVEEVVEDERSKIERMAQIERDSFARMNDAQQAQHVLNLATGLGIIPTRNYEKDKDDLGLLIKNEGREGAIAKLKDAYDAWTKRRTRDGRAYSRQNTGFIEWAINGIPDEYKPTSKNAKPAPEEPKEYAKLDPKLEAILRKGGKPQ